MVALIVAAASFPASSSPKRGVAVAKNEGPDRPDPQGSPAADTGSTRAIHSAAQAHPETEELWRAVAAASLARKRRQEARRRREIAEDREDWRRLGSLFAAITIVLVTVVVGTAFWVIFTPNDLFLLLLLVPVVFTRPWTARRFLTRRTCAILAVITLLLVMSLGSFTLLLVMVPILRAVYLIPLLLVLVIPIVFVPFFLLRVVLLLVRNTGVGMFLLLAYEGTRWASWQPEAETAERRSASVTDPHRATSEADPDRPFDR
jgi:hypothetical protein